MHGGGRGECTGGRQHHGAAAAARGPGAGGFEQRAGGSAALLAKLAARIPHPEGLCPAIFGTMTDSIFTSWAYVDGVAH